MLIVQRYDPYEKELSESSDERYLFSDGIISHWINIATTGRPLSEWSIYDPSSPESFHITPNQGFVTEPWNRNCSFFGHIAEEGVRETFGYNY